MEDTSVDADQRGVRLLALDNGGILGLSELLILEEILHRIKINENLSDVPLPCEYFDLIGGVGTGGCVFDTISLPLHFAELFTSFNRLIAIMLGRLKMPIDKAIQAYVKLTKDVFSDKKLGRSSSIFKANQLEAGIKDIIQSLGYLPDVQMRVDEETHCFTSFENSMALF
ncbi:hypothetical protein H0H81_011293 [Sphagnurus paluster]|uniref:PNPLA domain-containing protein n=1 Tax=Sphagnurus paluster TaxID=117069 RepID=A0A9P7GPL0_9AGAR|nr:hypothetical protein H0H81_011293 [Sphagnurus paluster]